jgi:ribosomal protein L6P/L9E
MVHTISGGIRVDNFEAFARMAHGIERAIHRVAAAVEEANDLEKRKQKQLYIGEEIVEEYHADLNG